MNRWIPGFEGLYFITDEAKIMSVQDQHGNPRSHPKELVKGGSTVRLFKDHVSYSINPEYVASVLFNNYPNDWCFTDEVWKPVWGYEGLYEVSSFGRVRALPKTTINGHTRAPRLMKQNRHPSGHMKLTLRDKHGKKRPMSVHRLVAFAFHGPPESSDLEVCHNNGIPNDNRPSNLRWDTHHENMLDIVRHKYPYVAKIGRVD